MEDYYNAGYGNFGPGQQQQTYGSQMAAPAQPMQVSAQQPVDDIVEGMMIHSTPSFEAPAGDYNFYVESYTIGFYQPKNPAESRWRPCKTVDYLLRIPYIDPETGQVVYGKTTYRLKLITDFIWALAEFIESTGAKPEHSVYPFQYELPVGRTGVCAIEQRASNSGGLRSFVQRAYRPSQRPAVTMNDGLPFEPQAAYGA